MTNKEIVAKFELDKVAKELKEKNKSEVIFHVDAADYSLYMDIERITFENKELLLFNGKGGFYTDNAFTERVSPFKHYEWVGVANLEDVLADAMREVFRLTEWSSYLSK